MTLLLRHPLVFLGILLWLAAALVPALVFLLDSTQTLSLSLDLAQPLLLSAGGGAVAGLLTLTRLDEDRARGALRAFMAGALACAGATALMLGYVALRFALVPSATTFWSFEFVILFLLGAFPGLVLASKWFDLSEIGKRLSEPES